MGGSVATVKI